MNRQEANRLILQQISNMIEGAPDLRFHQILANMDINQTELVGEMPNQKMIGKDLYNEESVTTLKRITNKNA